MLATIGRAALLLAASAAFLHAQPPTGAGALVTQPRASADTSTLQAKAIRVFLDCQGRVRGCDRDFFVTDIPFVNWMRDRFDSDVQMLVTGLTNGGGGTELTIAFIGHKAFEGMADTLVLNTLPNDADDKIRRDLARMFKLGLTRYVARSPLASRLQVSFATPPGGRPPVSAANLKDRWNLWTYTTNMNAFVRAEERQRDFRGSLGFSANRSTAEWKMNFSLSGNLNEQLFRIPARGTTPAFTVTNEQRTYNANSLVVRTLSDHWSTGLKLGAGYSGCSRRSNTTSSRGRSRRDGSSPFSTISDRITTITSAPPYSVGMRRRASASRPQPRGWHVSSGARATSRSTG
jgi:hypothetical protein